MSENNFYKLMGLIIFCLITQSFSCKREEKNDNNIVYANEIRTVNNFIVFTKDHDIAKIRSLLRPGEIFDDSFRLKNDVNIINHHLFSKVVGSTDQWEFTIDSLSANKYLKICIPISKQIKEKPFAKLCFRFDYTKQFLADTVMVDYEIDLHPPASHSMPK